ncbi:MAG: YHYH protein [Planctomycetes bacterium]|nr:YHYH protein [Planctomycetota bacterium]
MRQQHRMAVMITGLLAAGWLWADGARAAEPEKRPVGGRWFVTVEPKPKYLYQGGDRFVDLFSYHQQDSNKDGIDNLRLSHDSKFLIIRSQGYPNHPTAVFPNSGNPNSIRVQDFTFRLPLEPRLSDRITRAPMGPIGMALNGVVFFNPFEAGGMNAVAGYSEVWLDSCCGHPQQTGVYHYHKYPSCVKSPFPDDGQQHSPIIGFAWDGFPVYGPYESKGVMAKDLTGERALDVCNGHEDAQRGFHYHVTPGQFPYIIGGYRGVVEPSNNRGLTRAGTGALVDNAEGESSLDNSIVAVRPGTAARGGRRELTLELNDAVTGRRAIPAGKPSWVQIGPYEALRIERRGNLVTIEIQIPDDASAGILLDCHLEFESPDGRGGNLVFKKNEAFRVVD